MYVWCPALASNQTPGLRAVPLVLFFSPYLSFRLFPSSILTSFSAPRLPRTFVLVSLPLVPLVQPVKISR